MVSAVAACSVVLTVEHLWDAGANDCDEIAALLALDAVNALFVLRDGIGKAATGPAVCKGGFEAVGLDKAATVAAVKDCVVCGLLCCGERCCNISNDASISKSTLLTSPFSRSPNVFIRYARCFLFNALKRTNRLSTVSLSNDCESNSEVRNTL